MREDEDCTGIERTWASFSTLKRQNWLNGSDVPRKRLGLAGCQGGWKYHYVRLKNIRKGMSVGWGEDDDLIVSYSYTFGTLALRPRPSIPIEFAATLTQLD